MSLLVTERLELPIEGMTCASCAARIERSLNKLEGVTASVNYATEKAAVEYDPSEVTPDALVEAVEQVGYTTRLPTLEAVAPVVDDDPTAALRQRLIFAAVLSLPVLLMGMISALQFTNWQWLALELATPVVLWAGWPFHVAAWKNLRHGAATMDTLISLGTLSAWGWSVVALFFLDAGVTGMKMPFELVPGRSSGGDQIYLEVAAVVVTFLLAGPLLRGAGEAHAPAQRCARSSSSAPRTRRSSTRTAASDGFRSASSRSATVSSSGRARRSRPTASSSRADRPSTSRC